MSKDYCGECPFAVWENDGDPGYPYWVMVECTCRDDDLCPENEVDYDDI